MEELKKGNKIYLIVNNIIQKDKIYEIMDIECETSGSRFYGHENTYYGILKDIHTNEIQKNVIAYCVLLTNEWQIYYHLIRD